MSTNNHLDELLAPLRSGQASLVGSKAFRESVWREIRHRKALGSKAGEPVDFVLFPRLGSSWLMAAFASVIFSVGLVVGMPDVRDGGRSLATQQALDLSVFSTQARDLPHNRLMAAR